METDKLLQNIYKGCDMGIDSICYVLDYVDNDAMLDLLTDQQDRLTKIKAKVKLELERMGFSDFEEVGCMAKMMSKMTVKMRLSMNRNSQKIAKMLYKGNEMGIQTLQEDENKLSRNNEEIPELAKEYRKMLNLNQTQLQHYL